MLTGFLFMVGVLLCLLCLRFWRFLLLAAVGITTLLLLLAAVLLLRGGL